MCCVSSLAIVGLYSTLARKVRTGDISPEVQEEALQNFEDYGPQRLIVEAHSGAGILRRVGC